MRMHKKWRIHNEENLMQMMMMMRMMMGTSTGRKTERMRKTERVVMEWKIETMVGRRRGGFRETPRWFGIF